MPDAPGPILVIPPVHPGVSHVSQRSVPRLHTVEPYNVFRMRGEWANWLASFDWTHFETLTFAEPATSPRAAIGRVRAYGRALERRSICSRRFAVVEGDSSTRLHVHCLARITWAPEVVRARTALSDDGGLHRRAWEEWKIRYGRARISPLSGDSIGAAFYLAKYLLKEDSPRWYFLPSNGWTNTIRA